MQYVQISNVIDASNKYSIQVMVKDWMDIIMFDMIDTAFSWLSANFFRNLRK